MPSDAERRAFQSGMAYAILHSLFHPNGSRIFGVPIEIKVSWPQGEPSMDMVREYYTSVSEDAVYYGYLVESHVSREGQNFD